MMNLIEKVDRQQQRSWRGALVAYFLLMVLLIVRHFFGTVLKEHNLNSSPLGIALLVALATPTIGAGAFLTSFHLKSSK